MPTTNAKFVILCYKLKNGQPNVYENWVHSYRPDTLEEALRVGHELTRDFVADSFRVSYDFSK
jgi:hypothetical protein